MTRKSVSWENAANELPFHSHNALLARNDHCAAIGRDIWAEAPLLSQQESDMKKAKRDTAGHEIGLTPVRKIESFCVIIRCVHMRGIDQDEAFTELNRRGLYLTADQARQAGKGV